MIIAVKEKDRVVMAYSGTDIWVLLAERDFVDEENIALKFAENGTLFGFLKMDRRSDLLLYDEDFLHIEASAEGIVREMIPTIQKKLSDDGRAISEEGDWGNAIIIATKDRLYGIDSQFGFYEADDYICYSYKDMTFRSVLDLTQDLPAEERIVHAVRFVSRVHKESLFPMVITDTVSKQFKYVDEGGVVHEHIDCL